MTCNSLIGAAVCGVAGGLIGMFTESGGDSDEAHVYAEGVRRSGCLSLREWTNRISTRPLPFSSNPVPSTSTKGDVHSKRLAGSVMTGLPVRASERTRIQATGRSSRRSQDSVGA